MKPSRQDFESRDALAEEIAAAVAELLRAALAERGRASLAVPGGTTPGPFLSILTNSDLDWSKVTVTLTDERQVPVTDERSNHRLLRETLFQGPASAARFVPLYGAAPDEDLEGVSKALSEAVLPLDVCVLGMGSDLHTASLFPGGEGLAEALDDGAPPVMAMRAPGATEPRITLTAPVLRGAAALFLLITGEAKAVALEKALAAGAVSEAPVRAVLRGPTPVHIFYAP